MSILKNFRLVALIAALVMVLAACQTDDANNTTATGDTSTTDDTAEDDAMGDDAMGDEDIAVTIECGVDLPEDGPGSAEGMAEDPAATAASNNPELSTLVAAVEAAGLVDTLNDPDATYTIFAPANAAFEEIPEEDLNALLENTEALTEVLTLHVSGEDEMDIQSLVDEGELNSLAGESVTVDAQDEQTVLVGDVEAEVVCADVETANATVHIIDAVLMPSGDMGDMDDPEEETPEDE